MNRRLIFVATCALAISAQAALAQAPRTPAPQSGTFSTLPNAAVPVSPQPPPPPPAPAAPSSPAGQAVNVKVEFTITDERGTAPPVKRVVSVIASDRNLGRVRSSAFVTGQGGAGPIPLNVDATPTLLRDGKIQLQFTLSYDWPAPDDPTASRTASGIITRSTLSDSVTLVLVDGRSMIAAQSTDPVGDRTVTVEVKATILK
jgi:hypothetical protein